MGRAAAAVSGRSGAPGEPPRTSRAVVVGGSMAGLLAARALADHFDKVAVVERDALPAGAEQRRGVPQGRMLHALLPRGLGILNRMFPGYGQEREVLAGHDHVTARSS